MLTENDSMIEASHKWVSILHHDASRQIAPNLR